MGTDQVKSGSDLTASKKLRDCEEPGFAQLGFQKQLRGKGCEAGWGQRGLESCMQADRAERMSRPGPRDTEGNAEPMTRGSEWAEVECSDFWRNLHKCKASPGTLRIFKTRELDSSVIQAMGETWT